MQGVENIYEIDTTAQILKRASELTGVKYGKDEKSDIALRVVAPPSAGPPLRPAGAPVGLPVRGFSASRAKETTKATVAKASKKGVFFMFRGFLSKFNQKSSETYILWP